MYVIKGIYDHEHEVFMECKALKEAANSLATYDNLLYAIQKESLYVYYEIVKCEQTLIYHFRYVCLDYALLPVYHLKTICYRYCCFLFFHLAHVDFTNDIYIV